MCAPVRMQRPEIDVECPLPLFTFILLRQGLLFCLELGWWQAGASNLPSSIPHKAGITGTWSTISRIVRGSWGLNSGPQVCTSCALLTHQAISIAPYLLQEDNSLAMGVSFVFIQQHCGGSASKKMQVQPPGIAE